VMIRDELNWVMFCIDGRMNGWSWEEVRIALHGCENECGQKCFGRY